MSSLRPFLAAALLLGTACCAALPAAAQDFKSFKDWLAACDNLRNCSAYGFVEDLGAGFAYLRIERGGAPDAPVRISLTVETPENSKFTLRFDDPSLPGLPSGAVSGEEGEGHDMRRVVLADTPQLNASLRKAQKIVVTREDPPGRKLKDDERISTVSLSGAAAAFLWIDDRQKRLDTDTALIRRGAKPASAVPPQPQAPVIVRASPSSAKAPKPSPDLLRRARSDCGDDERAALEEANSLSAQLFLYSYTCPDNSGAYNFNSVYYIVPAGQPKAARIVSFRWPVRIAGSSQGEDLTSATNASFDPKTMTLQTFSKGRGIGDCGSEERWVFDGKTFRLAELRVMTECKGVPLDDWPVLYRAQVR